jgi:flagellar basal body-associated protein FliL
MASEEKAPESGDQSAAKPKRKIPVVLVGLGAQVLVMFVALGLVAKGVLFTKAPSITHNQLKERAIASIKDDSVNRKTMDLKEFTINLNANHVLKTSIELEVSDEKTAQIIQRRMPAIKYKIINLLAFADARYTGSFQGKLALKDSLREAINQEIIDGGHTEGVVREVFFTTFFLM